MAVFDPPPDCNITDDKCHPDSQDIDSITLTESIDVQWWVSQSQRWTHLKRLPKLEYPTPFLTKNNV